MAEFSRNGINNNTNVSGSFFYSKPVHLEPLSLSWGEASYLSASRCQIHSPPHNAALGSLIRRSVMKLRAGHPAGQDGCWRRHSPGGEEGVREEARKGGEDKGERQWHARKEEERGREDRLYHARKGIKGREKMEGRDNGMLGRNGRRKGEREWEREGGGRAMSLFQSQKDLKNVSMGWCLAVLSVYFDWHPIYY